MITIVPLGMFQIHILLSLPTYIDCDEVDHELSNYIKVSYLVCGIGIENVFFMFTKVSNGQKITNTEV